MTPRFLRMRRRARRTTRPVRRPLLETLEPRTLLSAVTWTGGGGDNNWDTPANWSTDSVPVSTDDVTINIAADVVHSTNVTDSINSLTSTEPLTISGGTLSIAAASTIDSTLSITGGTLTGTGDVTVSGLVTLTVGTLSGTSALNANGGMLINPPDNGFNGNPGVNDVLLDGRIVNNAAGQTATWTGTSNSIAASDGSVFNNLGAFVDQAQGQYFDTGIGGASSFVDRGSVTQSGNSADAEFFVPFNVPGGSVDVQNLEIGAGGSSTGGTFTLEGVLDIENDAYTFDPTTSISGDGGITFADIPGTQVLPGDYSYTGATDLEGSLQIDGSIAGSALEVDGNLSGTGTVGSIDSNDGGNLSPGDGSSPGILHVQQSVQLENGDWVFTVALNGPTAGAGYSQLDVSGPVNLGGTQLDASLGFTPANGEQFTIIKSTAPIVGTFDQLPEGASLTIGNLPFTISYHGGDGNDVVLTQAVAAAPTVAGISPNSGPVAGGTSVTITGTGFTGATAVDFGTNQATGLIVVNDTTITADSPAGTGTVDVTVMTPGGTSATSAADRFTYTAAVVAAPTVTGVSPDSGPTAGGTTVTIAGTGFTGATAVDFGTTAATDVIVVNGTTITAVSPAGAGVADVTVITSAGASATTPADRFTYVAPPVTVVSVNRFGFHMHPTTFVLTFDSPLDAVRASDPASYQLVDMAHPLRRLGFRSATYNPANQSVTLSPVHRLYLYDHYRLTVANPRSMAVTAAGDPAGGGTAGGDFVTTISQANLVLTPAQRRDRPLLALIRSLAARFPGLAHLVDGRAPRPGA